MSAEPNGYMRRNSLITVGIGVAGLILPAFGIMLTGLIWLVQETTELRSLINSLELRSTQSISERQATAKQAEENRIQVADLERKLSNEITERVQGAREIETQFSALHNASNVSDAELHRMNSIAWRHIPGLGEYPSGPYTFSDISKKGR